MRASRDGRCSQTSDSNPAALLLRDHAAAWALFGLFAFGGRDALWLLIQPASADKAAGITAVVLLAAAAIGVLAGRRERAAPVGPPSPPGPLDPPAAATSPWSGSA